MTEKNLFALISDMKKFKNYDDDEKWCLVNAVREKELSIDDLKKCVFIKHKSIYRFYDYHGIDYAFLDLWKEEKNVFWCKPVFSCGLMVNCCLIECEKD